MQHNLLKILNVLAVIIVFNRCAQIGILNGGMRDQTPPKLIQAIPELKTLQFNSDIITLRFDEFIQLRDINNQLVISPKLKTKPEITANGKKITIKLNRQELIPNTTYRIYFGKAIADMHEGNLLNNFSYIFSTGNQIDSINLKGTVINALSLNKEKDVVVGLFFSKNLIDSFVFKNTPDYVTRTNENGQFELNNLPQGEFKLLCFTDKNKDYMYNGAENEQIGFLNDLIKLTTDSTFKINLFSEVSPKTFIKKVIMNENGEGTILFNQKTRSKLIPYDLTDLKNIYQLNYEKESDSCRFYYRNFKDTLWLKLTYGNSLKKISDTLKLKVPVLKSKYKKIIKAEGSIITGKQDYHSQPIIFLSQWIDTSKTNLAGIHLTCRSDTTLNKKTIGLKSVSYTHLTLPTKA